jgi:glycosyltransferase involved in cell wall biosynthesis|tara:strand:- start:3364 stop:4614 length:1251 start_codon:yes stop_codon:yes gene_type:complete
MTEDGKFKVLVLSDHALSTSGVGTQTRHLIEGLLKKGCWSFRQFGAALKHQDYRTVVVNEDFIIKPIDGFGSADLIRVTLATEKPDVLFIFTDPRFFTWLFDIEDEIRQICPIVWWHVWDNYPYPKFNDVYYEATDLINCHSHMTYTMLKEKYPEKTNFIPHALPDTIFNKLPKREVDNFKRSLLGEDRKDHFVGMWINRNAKRKRPSDLLVSWKMFLDELYEKEGHRNATLIMHTEPLDNEGPNLFRVAELLEIQGNVFFSRDRLEFEKVNVLYNISDFCINTSYAEGFGLGTLEAMMSGTPIIAPKTGGLTRQVVDYRDGTENGVACDIAIQTLVGSQSVPYIYEDYASNESYANAMMKLYSLNSKEKSKLSEKVYKYAHEEFGLQKTIDMWHETMIDTLQKFKKNKKWDIEEI